MTSEEIVVIGGGAWGTALALALARAVRTFDRNGGAVPKIRLWTRSSEFAAVTEASRINSRYLPEIRLADEICVTAERGYLANAKMIIVAVPSQLVRTVMSELAPLLRPNLTIISTAKGLEQNSQLRMSEVIREIMPDAELVVLSGPGFAREVALGQPTAVTIAAQQLSIAEAVIPYFASRSFRPYPSTDIIGVELGGAVKNVIAIACGLAAGLGFGDNARAALITRGLAELTRFGISLGGKPETFSGLAGVGDLVLTCCGAQSRNFRFGYALGQGQSLAAALDSCGTVEGITAAKSLVTLAEKHAKIKGQINLPVASGVAAVIGGKIALSDAVEALLSRPIPVEECA